MRLSVGVKQTELIMPIGYSDEHECISETNKRLVKEVCKSIIPAIEYTYCGQQAKVYDCVKALLDKDKLGKSPYVSFV